jgi:hypothetical protein
MMFCLPIYSLEWLIFTLNHVSQINRNTHVQVLYSCCNMSVHTILQMKAILQLTFFRQVTSLQLNIYDEHGQCTHTPQTYQRIVQSDSSRMSLSKNVHALCTFKPILLPSSTNGPPGYLRHCTIICKLPRCSLPHPMSHTKGERTPPKSFGLRSAHSS